MSTVYDMLHDVRKDLAEAQAAIRANHLLMVEKATALNEAVDLIAAFRGRSAVTADVIHRADALLEANE